MERTYFRDEREQTPKINNQLQTEVWKITQNVSIKLFPVEAGTGSGLIHICRRRQRKYLFGFYKYF